MSISGSQMTVNETLKKLMLELIYPAVLGTVLYTVLGAGLAPLLAILGGPAATVTAPLLKWILVIITLCFYGCDYLYIMFTRDFRPAFFLCDLIFLGTLYITFLAI